MVVVLAVVGVVLVVVIALVAVGRETFTLAVQPKQAHFDLEEAVQFVADRLPDEVTAVLTFDDVRSVIRWHLEYLRLRGVPVRRDQADDGALVVVEDDEGIAFVLGRADEAGLEVTDTEVAIVLEGEVAYFEAIGAIGPEVE
ncbi:MAG TPA: hypothetical protein VGZ52_07000 [Acidimicrobiales bacterium]|jgi:hypothetical protein|nr:hypothetical protein [Acidimicrobiales bacterium]